MTELFHLKFEISSSGDDLDFDCEDEPNHQNKNLDISDNDEAFNEDLQKSSLGQRKYKKINVESFTNYHDENKLRSMLDWQKEGEEEETDSNEEKGDEEVTCDTKRKLLNKKPGGSDDKQFYSDDEGNRKQVEVDGESKRRRSDERDHARQNSLADDERSEIPSNTAVNAEFDGEQEEDKEQRGRSDNKCGTLPCKPCSRSQSSQRIADGGTKRPISENQQSLNFFYGNPSVSTTHGTVHLYKESCSTSSDPNSEMICILAIPAKVNTSDLMQFIASVESWIQHLKIIRDDIPNQYMALIKFRSKSFAKEFFTMYEHQPFNSFEPEICQCVYVSSVQIIKEKQGGSLPISGLTELPICPVCLEKLDESVSGILTVLCNHSFHGNCLTKWVDTSCPVCRYIQTPEETVRNICSTCSSASDSLWICLICGNVGCGRYAEGCAYRHYENTNHTFSMEMSNNRVWDYAGDNYVHRLIQSKTDGKMVPLENQKRDEMEKHESLTLEYTHLLTSQLESQRAFFEDKLRQLEIGMRRSYESSDQSGIENDYKQIKDQNLHLKAKYGELLQKFQKLNSEFQDEKELNKSLINNQESWKTKLITSEKEIESKKQELEELAEQNRDLMFFMESSNKLAEQSEQIKDEIQKGTITIGKPQPSTSKIKKGKKNK